MTTNRWPYPPAGAEPAPEPPECRVELYGSAQVLAGERDLTLPAAPGMTLGDLVLALAERLPVLVGPVLAPERRGLAEGYIFNRGGRDFLTDPATPVRPGDRWLLLASIAGGSSRRRRRRAPAARGRRST